MYPGWSIPLYVLCYMHCCQIPWTGICQTHVAASEPCKIACVSSVAAVDFGMFVAGRVVGGLSCGLIFAYVQRTLWYEEYLTYRLGQFHWPIL